jgi:excisionase family DNA binding protein
VAELPDFLTPPEAAKVIGVSERRVQQLIAEGRVQGAGRYGNTTLIPRPEVERLAREGWPGRRRRRDQGSDEGYPGVADDPGLNEDAAREAWETPGMGS